MGLLNKRKLPQNLQGNTNQKSHVKGLITTHHNGASAYNSESMLQYSNQKSVTANVLTQNSARSKKIVHDIGGGEVSPITKNLGTVQSPP